MQSNKASKKTRKAAANPAVPGTNAGDAAATPRVPRSSQLKTQETNDTASSSHRHKVISPASDGIVEPTIPPVEVRESESRVLAGAARARELSAADVANLAYTYFAARGYQHGHAEEDWLRAERELRSAHSA